MLALCTAITERARHSDAAGVERLRNSALHDAASAERDVADAESARDGFAAGTAAAADGPPAADRDREQEALRLQELVTRAQRALQAAVRRRALVAKLADDADLFLAQDEAGGGELGKKSAAAAEMRQSGKREDARGTQNREEERARARQRTRQGEALTRTVTSPTR